MCSTSWIACVGVGVGVAAMVWPASSAMGQSCDPQWSPLGTGMGGTVLPWTFALEVYDDGLGAGPALYAGGNFFSAGGVTANRIARWDGQQWSPLSSAGVSGVGGVGGSDTSVAALAVYDDGAGPALYAAGEFATAGGVAASSIARWDGQRWSPLGDGPAQGVDGTVSALAVYDDGRGPALYAAGNFSSAGGVSARNIAKWDGAAWSALGALGHAIDGVNGGVFALQTYDDGAGEGLYAAGNFSSAGGVAASGIARWDGAQWSSLAGGSGVQGVSGTVSSLAVYDDGSGAGPSLYVGGFFLSAGGVSVGRIARWDGSDWSALESGGVVGVGGDVRSLGVVDGPAYAPESRGLYVGGEFTDAGGVEARNIVRWDGGAWSPLAAGLDSQAFTIAPAPALGTTPGGGLDGPALFVGGAFTTADGQTAERIARWDLCPGEACRADLDGDGELTIFDFLTFQNLFDAGRSEADFDGDGELTIFDFLAFQNAFDAGCA